MLSTVLSLEESRPADRRLSLDELAGVTLDDYFARLAADDPDGLHPCFVFDQFEELVTLDPTDVDAKRAFLEELGVALRDRSRWALFAMREDFIAQLDPFLGLLPTRLAGRYRLDLLGPAAAKDAVKRPAAVLGVVFTDEAATRLIDDLRRVKVQRGATVTEEPGPHVEPVQLQVACRRLWSSLDPTEQDIGIDDVTVLGNVDEALADFYEDAIHTATARSGVAEREIRTWVDARLITEHGFRAQALEGPGPAGPAVLAALEDAHLIRSEQRGTLWYELSHDRLVAPVRDSNAAWRVQHLSTLQREAQSWDRQGRPAGMLMTGEVLAEAEQWAATHPDDLLAVDREYLEACQAEEQRLEASSAPSPAGTRCWPSPRPPSAWSPSSGSSGPSGCGTGPSAPRTTPGAPWRRVSRRRRSGSRSTRPMPGSDAAAQADDTRTKLPGVAGGLRGQA